MKKLTMNAGNEINTIYVSSAAKIETAADTITVETSGPCFGPDDLTDSDELIYLLAHWSELEEMEEEESTKRIAHLAEEWNLDEDDLDYLV